jgi:hypothetical protein
MLIRWIDYIIVNVPIVDHTSDSSVIYIQCKSAQTSVIHDNIWSVSTLHNRLPDSTFSAVKSRCLHTTRIFIKQFVCSNSHHCRAQNSLEYLTTVIFSVKHKNIVTLKMKTQNAYRRHRRIHTAKKKVITCVACLVSNLCGCSILRVGGCGWEWYRQGHPPTPLSSISDFLYYIKVRLKK